METAKLILALLKVIASIAAAELGIPSCQPVARQQQMRRGYTHQFYCGPKSDHIYRGTGSAYRNGTTGSYLTCAGMCLQDDACKSFNFCLDKKRCEMNAAVFSNMTDLLHMIGCMYFDEEYHEPLAEVECAHPLGLEDGTIPDERMSASSVWSTDRLASAGRLNNPDSCWAPEKLMGSWIQVDLGETTLVSGVITQGHPIEWHIRVTKYEVAFKKDHSSALEHVTDANGDIEVFDGNVDDDITPVTNMFDQSIIAVTVRVEPVEWVNNAAIRLELLGCYITHME